MTIMRHKHVSFEIKSAEADTGIFKGHGSVFNNTDSYGDVVMPGAFAKSLARHKSAGSMPALLWQHDSKQPIGIYKAMEEDEIGLSLEGQFALKTRQGAEAHELTMMKAVRGLSIGFTIPKNGMEFDEEENVYRLKEIDLWEVSVVTFPANGLANITDVRSALREGKPPTERDFEDILREAGYSRTDSKQIIAKGYREFLREAEKASGGDEEEIDSLIKRLTNLSSSIKG